MKQKKTLQILLLVFAGLIVLYTGVNLYQKQQSSKEDSDQTMISDLKSLTSISYNNNGTTLSFIKQNGKWYYTKNKKYPITQSSLESLASTFQKVEAVRELKNADALSDYGLDKPTYTVSVKDKTGKSMTYYIGNATGENYYVTYGDKSKIYTVSSDITSSLSYSLDNLIETDTFPTLSTGNLKKVLVTQSGKTKTYTSKEKNLDGISGGLGVFTFGDCQNYYASQTDLVKYGLDKDSRITVDITYKDTDTKKTKNVVLYIGKKDSDQKNYYVQLKGSHMVYLSDKDVVKNILKPYHDYCIKKQKGLQLLEVLFHAADRNRTGTRFNSNRILSPARLPVPPLRLSGGRRIRTFEGGANRFTVCPLWPLGNPTKCLPDN